MDVQDLGARLDKKRIHTYVKKTRTQVKSKTSFRVTSHF